VKLPRETFSKKMELVDPQQ
jgi:hypothetical protein